MRAHVTLCISDEATCYNNAAIRERAYYVGPGAVSLFFEVPLYKDTKQSIQNTLKREMTAYSFESASMN